MKGEAVEGSDSKLRDPTAGMDEPMECMTCNKKKGPGRAASMVDGISCGETTASFLVVTRKEGEQEAEETVTGFS